MADDSSGDLHKSDRRSEPRRPIELKVEYKRINTFFADYTKNISRGGTFIKTSRPLPVGTEFLFKLYVPNLNEPLTIHGEVQRIIDPPQRERVGGDRVTEEEPGMAIKFVYREGDPEAVIARTVETMMTDSLGPRLYARLMDQALRKKRAT